MASVKNWVDVEPRYDDVVLIGNGASIAINEDFSYSSIYELADRMGHLGKDEKSVFGEYKTTDFERVIGALRDAKRVNETVLFGDERANKISDIFHSVKQALRDTIIDRHVTHDRAKEYFPFISNFISNFQIAFSLNYDLIMYWSNIWASNHGRYDFRDCFSREKEGGELIFNRGILNKDDKDKVFLFYPHGNFAIAKKRVKGEKGKDVKVESHNANLLQSVANYWMSDKYDPVMVSEGSSNEKMNTIRRNSYLRKVYFNVMNDPIDNIVFYGFDFRDSDFHIVDRLFKNPDHIRRVAVSVHQPTTEFNNFASRVKGMIETASLKNGRDTVPDVEFFDAESEGAWIHSSKSHEEVTGSDDVQTFEPDDELPF